MKYIIKLCLGLLILLGSGCKSDDDSVGITPSDVTLVSPYQNESCEEGVRSEDEITRLFFEWERADNAQYYDLVVTDLETGEHFIVYEEIYDTTKELELIRNKPYSWQVISKTSLSEETGSSPIWNFFLVGEAQTNYAPFPATLVNPSYGKDLDSVDGTVLFEWSGSDPDNDKLSYVLYVYSDDKKENIVEEVNGLEVEYVEVQLEPGSTYFWRIKSSDGSSSSFSPLFSFTL